LGVKRKRVVKRPPASAESVRRKSDAAASTEDDQIQYGGSSLHDLFQQQVRTMLDRSDLDEEQKQAVLVAASCPCCGGGGMSLSFKLKRRK
jgi:hypothetical protein